jgi:hypothetical protein
MPVKFDDGLSEMICHFRKWNALLVPFSPRASCRWAPRSNSVSRSANESNIRRRHRFGYTIERPINQRSDGDCALSLSTPVASRNGHVGHTARPYGSGSRRTATGAPDPPSLRLTRRGSCRTKAMLFMGQDTSSPQPRSLFDFLT